MIWIEVAIGYTNSMVLKRFFSRERRSGGSEKRKAALHEMASAGVDGQLQLALAASTESDQALRTQAVSALDSVPLLVALSIDRCADEASLHAAMQRQRETAPEAATERTGLASDRLEARLSDASAMAALDQHLRAGERAWQQQVAVAATVPVLRDRALQLLQHDESALAQVCTDARTHATRAAAAAMLTSGDAMEQALRQLRKRDKQVARELQQRLQQQRRAAADKQAHADEIEQCLQGIQQLEGAAFSPQYSGQHAAWLHRWQQLDPAPTATQQAVFDGHEGTVRERVEAHRQQQQLQTEQQTLAQSAKSLEQRLRRTSLEAPDSDDLHAELAQLNDEHSRLLAAGCDAAGLPRLTPHRQLLRTLQAAVEINTQHTAGSGETTPRQLLQRLDQTLKKAPGGELQATTELQSLRPQLAQQVQTAATQEESERRDIKRMLGQLNGIVDRGEWKRARSLSQRIESRLEKLDDQAAPLRSRLAGLQGRVNELGDWKDFAARPKLEALCESMEALPAAGLPPQPLADEIRQLQQSWKAIGDSEGARELWPRFKQAGDKAYEPCAAYFSELQAERDQRKRNKEAVCEQLAGLLEQLDAGEPPLPEAAELLKRQAAVKREWSQNRVRDRKPDAALEQRFSDLLQRLELHLAPVFESSVAAREDLIARMQQLAEQPSSQHVVNQARRLQAMWKQVGPIPRSQDRQLWDGFKTAGDAVFGARKEAQQQQYRESMQHVYRAREIIKHMQELGQTNASGDGPDESQFQQLQQEFQQLPEFPEKDQRNLERDMRMVSDAFGQAVDQHRQRAEHAQLDELRRLAGLCQQLERLASATAAESQTSREEVQSQWENPAVELAPAWRKRVQARRDAALAGESSSSEIAEQRRLLCIQLEILSDQPSPDADRQARMAWQLQQLQAGNTGGATLDSATLQEFEVDWLCLPGEAAGSQGSDTLDSRFQRLLQLARDAVAKADAATRAAAAKSARPSKESGKRRQQRTRRDA